MKEFIDEYLEGLFTCLKGMDYDAIETVINELIAAGKGGKKVFIFGNGGSAATASHFANDLNYKASETNDFKFKAFSLTDNVPIITAVANDSNYEDIFVSQIRNVIEEDDIAVGLSGSGNSENVLKALRFARQKGALTVGFSGEDGGQLEGLVDVCLHPTDEHYGRVEDSHLFLEHLITEYIRKHN